MKSYFNFVSILVVIFTSTLIIPSFSQAKTNSFSLHLSSIKTNVEGVLSDNIGRRVALVIGNSNYQNVNKLLQAKQDAEEVAKALKGLNFEIYGGKPYLDLKEDQDEMKRVIAEFMTSLRKNDFVVIYYTGHGIAIDGSNLLIPVDIEADITSVEVQTAGVNLENEILEPLSNKESFANIILLDACNNSGMPSSTTLKKPNNTSAKDTVVSYAQSPTKAVTANSLYTKFLLDNIREPGLRIDDLFNRIRNEVSSKSNNQQLTQEFGTLTKAIYFREPAYLDSVIENADDDAKILINNEEVSSWRSTKQKRIFLRAGDNSLEIKVFNQRSYGCGLLIRCPEGWSYGVRFTDSKGKVIATFSGAEDRPADNGPRHGNEFTVATADINVDKVTGNIQIKNIRKLNGDNLLDSP